MSKEEINSITLKMEAAVPLKHWNEHITLHSVKKKLARLLSKLEFYYVLITLTLLW